MIPVKLGVQYESLQLTMFINAQFFLELGEERNGRMLHQSEE